MEDSDPLDLQNGLSSQLEEINCVNSKGENNICVKIPEVIHVYLFGSSF